MKRILLAVALVLAVSIAVFAQETNIPTSAQTKENATQYLNQAKSNSQDFDSILADLRARNVSNADLYTFNRLKGEIEALEAQIKAEERQIANSLNKKLKLNDASFGKMENLIAQHKAKQDELQEFISSR
jgi:hypothetical protein